MTVIVTTIVLAILMEVAARPFCKTREWRVRLIETILAIGIGLSALCASIFHRAQNLSIQADSGEFGRIVLLSGLGFYIYHLHRLFAVPAYTRSLIYHHIGMILAVSGAFIADRAYFYMLLASIPITSAAVRNFRWFWKSARRPKWVQGSVLAAGAYLGFESIPPIVAVTHFFTIGVKEMVIPPIFGGLVVVPGLMLSLLAFYYSAVFIRKVSKS